VGFGLTLAAWTWFRPVFDRRNEAAGLVPRDDLALRTLVHHLVEGAQGVTRLRDGGIDRIVQSRVPSTVDGG
jgi:hypothetical protein